MPYDENGEWYYDENVDETDYGGDTNPDNPGVGSYANPYDAHDVNFDQNEEVVGDMPPDSGGEETGKYPFTGPIDQPGGGGNKLTSTLKGLFKDPLTKAAILRTVGGTLENLTAQPTFQRREPWGKDSDFAKFGAQLRGRPDVDLSGIRAQNPMNGMADDDQIAKILKDLK